MTLHGLPTSQIITPFGLIELSRDGTATLSTEQAEFIGERITAGSLAGYQLIEAFVPDKTAKK